MDEAYVRNILDQQTNSGWVAATTLHEYHFMEETHELNSAGQHQLYWILNQAPAQFRTVYLAEGMSPQVAQLRLAQVQAAVKQYAPTTSTPVVMRPAATPGRPAEEIDHLRRLELQSLPRPRLFTVGVASRGTSGGAGAGAGGGGGNQQSASSGNSSGGGGPTR
jgi:uncharacterized membrane protein YgcG